MKCSVSNFIKRFIVLSTALISISPLNNVFAKSSCPVGIVGAQGDVPYAAFLMPSGTLITLPGLPPTGLIYRVAMNSSRNGLIGGTNGLNTYAALVSR